MSARAGSPVVGAWRAAALAVAAAASINRLGFASTARALSALFLE
jgi:hypothetical protein